MTVWLQFLEDIIWVVQQRRGCLPLHAAMLNLPWVMGLRHMYMELSPSHGRLSNKETRIQFLTQFMDFKNLTYRVTEGKNTYHKWENKAYTFARIPCGTGTSANFQEGHLLQSDQQRVWFRENDIKEKPS